MNKNLMFKLGLVGICAFGIYKLTKLLIETQEKIAEQEAEEERRKAAEEAERKKRLEEEAQKAEEHKKEVLAGLNYNSIAEKTLNNEKIIPEDRAYLYEVYKKKLDDIRNAHSIEAVDKAKNKFDEFTTVWLSDHGEKTAEVLSSYIQMEKQKKLEADERKRQEEEQKEEKKRRDAEAAEAKKNRDVEIEKYKLITNAVTKGINALVAHQSWT